MGEQLACLVVMCWSLLVPLQAAPAPAGPRSDHGSDVRQALMSALGEADRHSVAMETRRDAALMLARLGDVEGALAAVGETA